jgi:hypothetical protein
MHFTARYEVNTNPILFYMIDCLANVVFHTHTTEILLSVESRIEYKGLSPISI